MEALKFEKVQYRRVCKFCGTKIVLDSTDLEQEYPYESSTWRCPICCMKNRETNRTLRRSRVMRYKRITDFEEKGT